MPNRCTWIDSVEFDPLVGGNLHFTIISGDEEMRFCISRAGAVVAANDAIYTIQQAPPLATVVPFMPKCSSLG